jgi:isoquinoline 1-oxidoreductase beta subunit
MSASPQLTRRSFLAVIGVGGASFALGNFDGLATENKGASLEPNAFVRLDPDGTVTIWASKSEMGQGIKTGLAMILAEQMDCDWTKVKALQADGNGAKYGRQGTGGSGSTRSMMQQLSQMGASARSMLLEAAAAKWGVDKATCRTDNGVVYHDATKKSITYGELASAASELAVPEGNVPLKARSEFRIVGKPTHRVDNREVVTGKALFAQDVQIEGAAYGVISRRPAFGASLRSFDDADARKVPGVIDVFRVSSGVAVIADNTWAALKGREALKVQWDIGPNASINTAELRKRMIECVGEHPAAPGGAKVIEAVYDFPYLAHYTMEPMNAVADVKPDRCTVWAPSQSPDGVQTQVARMLSLDAGAVTVHVPLLGGGFGRRGAGDFVADAVEASRQAKRPVKLLWTREDDMRNDGYRPMSLHAMRGAVDSSGKPVMFNHQFIKAQGGSTRSAGNPSNARLLYQIPNCTQMSGAAASPIPTGAWRSVDHSQVNVAIECFIDELAQAAGKDPLQFRRENTSDRRMLRMLDLAEEKSGWKNPLPPDISRGVACFDGYGGKTVHVVELSTDGGGVKLHRVVCCLDPGYCINPKSVEAQMQGACVDGLSTALYAEITIEGGAVVQSNPLNYGWVRMHQAPKIEVHIVEGDPQPAGMGETGYPGVPAAVANAVAAATGRRVRKFPIKLAELE